MSTDSMSAMSTDPTPITLQTNLRKLEPANDFKLQDVLLCQFDIQHDDDILPEERVPTTEYQAVRTAMKKYVAQPDYVLSSVDKNSFFADPKHRGTLERDLSRQAVLLTIHNGQDPPPETLVNLDYASVCASGGSAPNIVFKTEASKFEETYLSPEIHRWRRTQIITSNVSTAELRIALQRIAFAIDPEGRGLASVYCHGLFMRCQTLEVARLLPSLAAGEDFVDSSVGIEIPWGKSNKLILALMSLPIPPTNSKCAQYSEGLGLLAGTSPSLYLNGAPQSFITEKPHIFVTTDPRLRTLADLFDEQLKGVVSTDRRASRLKQLSIMLKGLQVMVRGSRNSDDDETHVVSVALVSNSQSTPFRPRPDLPLITVGSAQHFLDPTLCKLVPYQDLHSENMPSIARSTEDDRRPDVPTTSATTGSLSGYSTSPRQDKEKIDNLRAVANKFNEVLPRILFLEIGTDGLEPSRWKLVHDTLKARVQGVSQQPDEDSPSLSLKYEDKPDLESLWAHQIRQFVLAHESPRQRMLLVMCVQPGKKNAPQYEMLKRACDVQVGIPSISVNRDTLLAKSDDPSDAAAMVVGSICRKLRLRNPPTLTDPSNSRHLVISIHVEPFTPTGSDVLGNGHLDETKKEMVLVALVSRARESSVDYHTEVKLYSKSDFEKLGVTTLLHPFLESIRSSPRDLTILRPGYLVAGSATPDGSTPAKARHLTKESNDIAEAYAKIPGHRAFKYATLSEDKMLKVSRGGQASSSHDDNRGSLLITKLDARENTAQSSFWIFRDNKTADSTSGIKVTFIPSADSSSFSQMTAPDLPTTPRVSRVLSGLIKPPPSSDSGPADPPAPSNNTVAGVTSPEEVGILSSIWTDDHLELYDIKWPIPTHLAQSALKRAKMHLVCNDWENKNRGQTAPFYLPEVHRNVRDTLYYI
jgi:hypothetical protein